MAGEFANLREDGTLGFGIGSYSRALAAGYTNTQIAQSLGARPDIQVGMKAATALLGSVGNEAANSTSQLEGYEQQVNQLQGQYDSALKQSQEFERQAYDWENQFNQKSSEFEAAQAEADRYREQAVGQQLSALRSGMSSGGAGSSPAGIGTLASGRVGYNPSADDKAVEIEKKIKAESGALANKGNVVEVIRRAQPAKASSQAQSQQGSGSYYTSRFS